MFRNFSLFSSEKTRGKYFQIVLFILTLGIIFIPNDVFALKPTTSGYSCYYSNGNSSCGDLVNRTINSEYTISPSFSVNDKTDTWWKYTSVVIDLYNQDFCTEVTGGGTWRTWLFFNLPVNNMVDVTASYGNSVLSTVQTNNNDGYGLTLDIIIPQSFEDGTITISIKANTDIPLDPSYPLYLGISTYTDDTQTCQLGTGDIINSQNSNTNNIINNNNQNTQTIIDNFNNTINDTFTDCKLSKNLFNGKVESGKYNSSGNKTSDSSTIRNVDFISVKPNTTYIFSNNGSGIGVNLFQYSSDKSFLSSSSVSSGSSFTTSSDTYYINFYRGSSNTDKIQLEEGSTITMYEVYGENCTNKIDQTNDKLDNIDGTLNNSNVDGATGDGRNFFNNFYLDDNGGISDIVTLPLRVINGLISGENNCSALNFILFDKEMYFPGGCIMWDEVSSTNETLYQTIICGFFGYILLTKLFKDIEDLKNPNKEDVSTLDL